MKAIPQPFIRVAYAEDHHLVRVALSEKLEQTGKVKVTVSVGDGADVFPGKRTSNGELLKAITACAMTKYTIMTISFLRIMNIKANL